MLSLALAAAALAAAPRVASYDIRVELDPTTHRLHGAERITWRNPTLLPAPDLCFHLYLNAFAGEDTTFFRESGGRHRRHQAREEGWGWTQVRRVAAGGRDLTARLAFEAPDDGNAADRTVARLPLDTPVGPGETLEIDVEFEAQLPRVFARAGWAGDFHLLGQWFPKLAVYEEGPAGKAAWNCHQFHANSEFFADFGDYRVAITVPEGWQVGATGEVESRQAREGRQTFVYVQEAVHDFAAVVARDLTDIAAAFTDADVPRPWRLRAARLLGRPPEALRLPPVKLRLLLPTRLAPLAPRVLLAARAALAYHGLYYGPYPYRTLTIVVPPEEAAGSEGMEYPTFITAAGSWRDLLPPRSWRQEPELVTIHEIGHQFFYGLLASNEFEHAWMDEGLTTYAEFANRELLRRDLAPVPALPPLLRPPVWLSARTFLSLMPAGEAIDTPAWRFSGGLEYFLASYDHPALLLATCQRLAGDGPFARGMRAYADRFRFHHPRPEDFLTVMAEHVSRPAATLLRTGIERSPTCDFAIDEVRSEPTPSPGGSLAPLPGTGAPDVRPARTVAEKRWTNEVVVRREGELAVPVEIELVYGDGRRQRVEWDGQSRTHTIEGDSTSPLVSASLDPDGVLLLDRNRGNNRLAVHPSSTACGKVLLDGGGILQAVLAVLGGVL